MLKFAFLSIFVLLKTALFIEQEDIYTCANILDLG